MMLVREGSGAVAVAKLGSATMAGVVTTAVMAAVAKAAVAKVPAEAARMGRAGR